MVNSIMIDTVTDMWLDVALGAKVAGDTLCSGVK